MQIGGKCSHLGVTGRKALAVRQEKYNTRGKYLPHPLD